MRQKLTAEQKYNKEYYQAHKGEKGFEERRSRNAKIYRARPQVKKRRNAKLREKWANDPEYRAHLSAYQKAYRERKKLEAQKKMRGGKKGVSKKGAK